MLGIRGGELGLLGAQLLSGSFSAPAAFPTDVRLFCSCMSGLAFFELILLNFFLVEIYIFRVPYFSLLYHVS